MLIVFEGIDGCGKSSQVDAVVEALRKQGKTVVCTREPGGTALAEEIRQLVLNRPMDAMTELLLAFAARRDHVINVIRPALQRGDVVVCDRFVPSSFAYQGFGRGMDLAQLSALKAWTVDELEPDLILWFDLDPEQAARRRGSRQDSTQVQADRFEREAVDFFTRVRSGYVAHLQCYANDVVCRIDSQQSIEAVREQTLKALGLALERVQRGEGGRDNGAVHQTHASDCGADGVRPHADRARC